MELDRVQVFHYYFIQKRTYIEFSIELKFVVYYKVDRKSSRIIKFF